MDIDKRFNDYITYHTKTFGSNLFKCEIYLDFNNITPHIKRDIYYNTTIFNLKRYELYWIDFFTERGQKFFHISEMNIKTVNDKRNMNYKFYIKQPMEMIELNLNVIILKTPHLINSLHGSINHPSIKKYSIIPFKYKKI